MSVRHGLLAILDQGSCYGYQLRAEFERRTGAVWTLNVGQIYNTLDRLERDGLVSREDVDAHGHVYYAITDAGRAEARAWLDEPLGSDTARDEMSARIALAATLPGVDLADVLARQRRAVDERVTRLRDEPVSLAGLSPEQAARAIVAGAALARAEAEASWLDRLAAELDGHAAPVMPLVPSTQRPRRGRPPRVPAASA